MPCVQPKSALESLSNTESSIKAEVLVLESKSRNSGIGPSLGDSLELYASFPDEDCGSLERELTEELVHLMNSQVVYSLRRLLAADLKQLFVGTGCNVAEGPNPFNLGTDVHGHPKIGGVVITPYLTYNCLVDDFQLDTWTCETCELTAALNFLEKEQHLMECLPAAQVSENKEVEQLSAPKSNSTSYSCPDCHRTLHLTPVEVLKHKRSHVKS